MTLILESAHLVASNLGTQKASYSSSSVKFLSRSSAYFFQILPAANNNISKPGRQITIFLFLFNLSQWLVFTFEVQKVRASLVRLSNFYIVPPPTTLKSWIALDAIDFGKFSWSALVLLVKESFMPILLPPWIRGLVGFAITCTNRVDKGKITGSIFFNLASQNYKGLNQNFGTFRYVPKPFSFNFFKLLNMLLHRDPKGLAKSLSLITILSKKAKL